MVNTADEEIQVQVLEFIKENVYKFPDIMNAELRYVEMETAICSLDHPVPINNRMHFSFDKKKYNKITQYLKKENFVFC